MLQPTPQRCFAPCLRALLLPRFSLRACAAALRTRTWAAIDLLRGVATALNLLPLPFPDHPEFIGGTRAIKDVIEEREARRHAAAATAGSADGGGGGGRKSDARQVRRPSHAAALGCVCLARRSCRGGRPIQQGAFARAPCVARRAGSSLAKKPQPPPIRRRQTTFQRPSPPATSSTAAAAPVAPARAAPARGSRSAGRRHRGSRGCTRASAAAAAACWAAAATTRSWSGGRRAVMSLLLRGPVFRVWRVAGLWGCDVCLALVMWQAVICLLPSSPVPLFP